MKNKQHRGDVATSSKGSYILPKEFLGSGTKFIHVEKRKCAYIHCSKWLPTMKRSDYCSSMHQHAASLRRKRLASGKPLVWRGERRLGL